VTYIRTIVKGKSKVQNEINVGEIIIPQSLSKPMTELVGPICRTDPKRPEKTRSVMGYRIFHKESHGYPRSSEPVISISDASQNISSRNTRRTHIECPYPVHPGKRLSRGHHEAIWIKHAEMFIVKSRPGSKG